MPSTRDVVDALHGTAAEAGSKLLAATEDQWFDRKSIRITPAKLASHLIGMANADGGVIVVGLSEGSIEGTDRHPDRLNELMQAHVQHAQPAVPCRPMLLQAQRQDGTADHLLVIDVRPGETVYANTRDEVFLRVGDETRRLSYSQRQELLYDRGQGSYESRVIDEASVESIARDLLHEYANGLSAPDPVRLLHARGLAADDRLTVAGTLLFAQHPQRFMPEAFVRVLRYRGTDRGTGARQELLLDEKFEGPLAHQILKTRELVMQQQPRRRTLSTNGVFTNVPLVPEDAWLEGLVNAVVHRSYSLTGDHIRIEIFDDRIEIQSPGRFPGIFNTMDPLSSPRYARNPRVARVCADQSFGQELGEGIRRMFEEMRLAGLADPLYEQTTASVRLKLLAEPVDRRLEALLPPDTRLVIAALRDAGELSTGEISEIWKVSRVTANSRLKKLRELGMIAWRGKSATDPRASWSLPPA